MGTKHHQVALHVKSVLDTMALEGEEQMVEDNISNIHAQTTTAPPASRGRPGHTHDGGASPRSEAGGSCAAGGMSRDQGEHVEEVEVEEEDISSGGYSRAGAQGGGGGGAGHKGRKQGPQRADPIAALYTDPQVLLQGEAEQVATESGLEDMEGRCVRDWG